MIYFKYPHLPYVLQKLLRSLYHQLRAPALVRQANRADVVAQNILQVHAGIPAEGVEFALGFCSVDGGGHLRSCVNATLVRKTLVLSRLIQLPGKKYKQFYVDFFNLFPSSGLICNASSAIWTLRKSIGFLPVNLATSTASGMLYVFLSPDISRVTVAGYALFARAIDERVFCFGVFMHL